MIRVEFFTEPGGGLLGFQISGHSGYSEIGTDIVCAAVSSAAYMAANTITDVLHISAEVEAEDGYLYLRVEPKDANACRSILQGLKLHLSQQLEVQYPQNMNVSYLEV